MLKVVRSTILDQPCGAVWEVLRDFNGHDRWHPLIESSAIEKENPSDRVGCIRRFRLADGAELRERLLFLSDQDRSLTYCLLDTPVPLFNYVADIRLLPVTDGDRTFWEWSSRFDAPHGRVDELRDFVGERIYSDGFASVRNYLNGKKEPGLPAHTP